jgi:hypothetical protein
MREIIANWIGKRVHLTTRVGGLAGGVSQQGQLVQVSDGGVLLQLEKGQTFFPVSAILHISLLDGN